MWGGTEWRKMYLQNFYFSPHLETYRWSLNLVYWKVVYTENLTSSQVLSAGSQLHCVVYSHFLESSGIQTSSFLHMLKDFSCIWQRRVRDVEKWKHQRLKTSDVFERKRLTYMVAMCERRSTHCKAECEMHCLNEYLENTHTSRLSQ